MNVSIYPPPRGIRGVEVQEPGQLERAARAYLLPLGDGGAAGEATPGAGAILTGPRPSFSSSALLCPTGPTMTTGHCAGLIHLVTTRFTSFRPTLAIRPPNAPTYPTP